MPERSGRQGQRRRAKAPTTLSLPIIPSEVSPNASSSRTGRYPPPDERSGSRQSRAVERYHGPTLPDNWDDDDIPTMRALVASRSQPRLPATVTSRPLPAMLAPPPVRSTRRGALWQLVLLGVVLVTFLTSLRATGGSDAQASAFQLQASAHRNVKIADLVPTFTQLDPTIGYLSTAQYNSYWRADCGAAATSEVLTAWGDPHGAIGYVINDMVPHLSTAGLIDPPGAFKAIATKHHFSVVITNNITAAQLAEIVEVQGIPVIIGVRDDYGGYYRYFAPGHFMVVVGGDANGFQIVDSSTYFVHYLPTATFESLWDYPRATIFTPPDYGFQFP